MFIKFIFSYISVYAKYLLWKHFHLNIFKLYVLFNSLDFIIRRANFPSDVDNISKVYYSIRNSEPMLHFPVRWRYTRYMKFKASKF